jgi:hypothetical protein
MKAWRTTSLAALITVTLIIPARPFAQGRIVPSTHLQLGANFLGKPIPIWQNGVAVAFDVAVPMMVHRYTRQGALARSTPLVFPGAPYVVIRDATVSSNGRIAVCGTARDEGGSGATFIAWIDTTGAVEYVVRPAPFSASRVVFDDQGRLWAFGRELPLDRLSPGQPPHEMLRIYGSDGKLLQSVLPRAAFNIAPPNHPSDLSIMAASHDRIGIVMNVAREWVEVSTSGAIIGRWPLPGTARITGVGLTGSNNVYISIDERDKTGKTSTVFYKFDRPRGQFVSVDGSALLSPTSQWAKIIGVDGENLVTTNAAGTVVFGVVP